METENRVTPFSNGTEFMDWKYRNCEGCKKYFDKPDRANCEIDYEVGLAYISDGKVPLAIWERMGGDVICAERVAKGGN